MKKSKNRTGDSANQMVNVIRALVKEELDKREQVVLCQISKVSQDNKTYDIYVVPDFEHVIHNVKSELAYPLYEGDYVYVFKINNQFANAFIVHKI